MTPSPALTTQSDTYPADWYGKVPKRVRLLETVQSDYPEIYADLRSFMRLHSGELHDVWVNSHGAVSAILKGGKTLGLKPGEFEIIEWHPKGNT